MFMRGGGGMDWDSGIRGCKLVCRGGMNNGVPRSNTGTSLQYPIINHHEQGGEKECICVYNRVTLLPSRKECDIVNQLSQKGRLKTLWHKCSITHSFSEDVFRQMAPGLSSDRRTSVSRATPVDSRMAQTSVDSTNFTIFRKMNWHPFSKPWSKRIFRKPAFFSSRIGTLEIRGIRGNRSSHKA